MGSWPEHMAHHKIYEDHSTLSRPELAAELRLIADQLEADGEVTYGRGATAGSVRVPAQFSREVEVERTKHGAEVKVEIEFKWAEKPADAAGAPASTQP